MPTHLCIVHFPPFPLLQDNKEQPGLCDESEAEDDEPGMSLHSGLSTMRLLLGANDRRIHSQRFGMAHYDMALQREKQRMVCACTVMPVWTAIIFCM